jgi:hypothetical protein
MGRVPVQSLSNGRRRNCVAAAGLSALVGAIAVVALPTPVAAQNSAIEPEVGSSTSLPGMPPPPPGAPPMPSNTAAASTAAPAAPGPPSTTGATAASATRPTASPVPSPAPSANAATRSASSSGPLPPGGENGPPAVAAAPREPSSLTVVKWSFGPDLQGGHDAGGSALAAPAGRPLYLRLTVEGGEAAVNQLRGDGGGGDGGGGIPIVVHWSRVDAEATKGAPDLTTELTIGRGVGASALAGEVEHEGRFEWHTWTRKDTLTSGQWSVSVTYPDGRPVMCGQSPAPEPCRFSINIG